MFDRNTRGLIKSKDVNSWVLLETVFAPFKFCVPVLLTISFFLLEKSLSHRCDRSVISSIKTRLIRLAIPTLFWFSLMAILKMIQGDFSFWRELLGTMLAGWGDDIKG
jgi:fucose 4-O-acetylase-like acetyltransferase